MRQGLPFVGQNTDLLICARPQNGAARAPSRPLTTDWKLLRHAVGFEPFFRHIEEHAGFLQLRVRQPDDLCGNL